jgi:hypothetical protein
VEWSFKRCPEPAAEKAPPLPPSPPEPFRLGMLMWGEAAFTGEADKQAVGGRLYTDGPIAGARSDHPLRLTVQLDITSVPGETFSLTDVATFGRGADLGVGIAWTWARTEVGDQVFTTSPYVRGGFVTSFADEVLDRYLRRVEAGVEFAVALSPDQRARFRVGYCRDERSYIGTGQLCLAGEVPIGSKGVVFGGDALVNLSRATVSPQADIFRLYGGVDVTRMWTR